MMKQVLLAVILYALDTIAADYHQVNSDNVRVEIFEHSLCQRVTNNSGQAIFIPTKTSAQWTSFRSSSNPAGVTRADCAAVPTYVTIRVGTASYAATCTVTKPVGLAVGDLMVTSMYNAGAIANVIPPSGFTIMQASTALSGGYYSVMTYKIADAADVAATNFSFSRASGSFNECVISMVVYRGVDTTTPVAAYAGNYPAVSGTVNYLTVTSTANNSLAVTSGECSSGTAGTPTGYTSNTTSGNIRWASKVVGIGATGGVTGTNPGGTCAGRHFILNPIPVP